MFKSAARFWTLGLLGALLVSAVVFAQQFDPNQPPAGDPSPAQGAEATAPPQAGVDVQARGPVHEAFATPGAPPAPTILVPKQPPEPINEQPPDQKPDGNMVWVGGYWAYDDDRKDYLWVSGIWRQVPPGKQWVPGYWRQDSNQWQWVGGFWTPAPQQGAQQQVTYLTAPPAAPNIAPPGEPPSANSFYVPGSWYWDGTRYVWRAGYWAQVQPGYVWVAAHYSWTPSGYVYIPGYWDYALSTRGVLFAPVTVDMVVVGPGFWYRPVYVVPSTVVVDAFFVRPAYCHYYFGDYYGPVYAGWGFESCVVYSRRCYDPVFTYVVWEHRADPGWRTAQLNITMARYSGQAPRPARVVDFRGGGGGITTFHQYAAAQRMNVVHLNPGQVAAARQQAVAMHQSAVQRGRSELQARAGGFNGPHTATLSTPPMKPVGPAPAAHNFTQPGRGATAGATPGLNPNGTRGGPLNQQRPIQRPTIPQRPQPKNDNHGHEQSRDR